MKGFRLADLPLIVKIGFAPVLALLMLAITAGIAVMAQRNTVADLQDAVHVGMANSIEVQRISERITEAHGRLYMLLTHQAGKIEPEKLEGQTKDLVADLAQIGKDVAKLEAASPASEQPLYDKLRKQVEQTRSAADLVGSMMTADFSAAASFVAPFEQSYKQMVATLASVVKTTQDSTNLRAQAAEKRATRMELFMALGALVTLLLVLAIAWFSAFATRNDIQKIAGATERLAGGDNSIDFTTLERKDEMGAIIRSLTVFRDNQLRMIQMRRENELAQEARAKEVAQVIASLGTGMDHLAACDFRYRLADNFPAEYKTLCEEFNHTMEELDGTLKVITGVTADIQAETAGGNVAAKTYAGTDSGKTATLQETGAALVSALEAFRENEKRMVRMREENQAMQEAKAREQADVVAMLGDGLDHLATGDLTYKITSRFPDEYVGLRDDFNAAMEKLAETMSAIREVTGVIENGSGDVNGAVDDLSKRTEHQAATLEETAAALNEITTTVKSTAEGAANASESISSAKDDAINSGQVVKDTVTAMHDIKTSADQISQIVGAIDEITFQTNLLSLNASVEAARAGDAGKGFAVVATEVRELSHRTAKMAKEIKVLITASGTKVRQGVDLVEETGKTLDKIVSQIVSINDVINQIAASAREQSTGLEQINTAVTDMDTVTQQNSAMVQETTVASRSLAQQAEELSQLLSRFKVRGGAALSKAAPAGSRQKAPAKAASSPAERPAESSVKPRVTAVHSPQETAAKILHSAPGAGAEKTGDDWEEF